MSLQYTLWENLVTAIRYVVTFGSSFVPASPTPVVGARVARARQPPSRDRWVVESLGTGRQLVQIKNGYKKRHPPRPAPRQSAASAELAL